MPFHNRARELDVLTEVRRSPRAELLVLYGHRAGRSRSSLDNLTAMVREAYPEEFVPQPFASLETFLVFLAHLAAARPSRSSRSSTNCPI